MRTSVGQEQEDAKPVGSISKFENIKHILLPANSWKLQEMNLLKIGEYLIKFLTSDNE